MRSRRLIKKLSKSLAAFYKDAWLCEWDDELAYSDEIYSMSAKGIMHVGGGLDYWGEANEAYTVLEMAEMNFWDWASFCGCGICAHTFDMEPTSEVCKTITKRQSIRPTFKVLRKLLDENRIN